MPRDLAPHVFRRILCPVDFSPNSRAALRYAAMLARLSDAHLLVLYVDDPLLAAATATRSTARALIAAEEVELRRFVEGALRTATPAPATTLLTRAGKPAPEIVRAADRDECDLIVIGYRGAGRASRFFFGSTTEGVIRNTRVPVLAVPPARRTARIGGAQRGTLKRLVAKSDAGRPRWRTVRVMWPSRWGTTLAAGSTALLPPRLMGVM